MVLASSLPMNNPFLRPKTQGRIWGVVQNRVTLFVWPSI